MSDGDNWTSEWLKAQKKFVESWSDIAQDSGRSTAAKPADLWSDGFDLWRKQYPSTSENANHIVDKCMSVGRGYFSMADQIGRQIASGGKTRDVVDHWLEQLKSTLQQKPAAWSPLYNQPGHEFMAQWAAPSLGWQKMVATMIPGGFADSDPLKYGIGEDFDGQSIPGIGSFRESQEKHQLAVRLARQYFQANQTFNQALVKVSLKSLEEFQHKIAEVSEDRGEQSPASLRALYDLWVEISEAHYADYAMSAEYQSLYGDMVNKLMVFKKQYNELLDDFLQSLNLPCRRELDTLEQRVHQLRRENRMLRKELKEIHALLSAQNPGSAKAKSKVKPRKKTAGAVKGSR